MAIDFPVPSFVGETYSPPSTAFTYQWNGTVWTVQSGNAGGAPTVSDSPPTDPLVGDQWYQSSTGRLCIYYFDGNQSQWVEEGPGSAVLATQGSHAWGVVDAAGTLLTDFNVTSVVRNSVGRYTVVMAAPTVINPYPVLLTAQDPQAVRSTSYSITDASTFVVGVVRVSTGDLADGAFGFTVYT